MVLALLVAASSGDAAERADAVHAVLMWRSGGCGVSGADTALFVAALKVRAPRGLWLGSGSGLTTFSQCLCIVQATSQVAAMLGTGRACPPCCVALRLPPARSLGQ